MQWNVIYYNINRNIIEPYNVFNHGSFWEYAKKAAKKYKEKEEFSEQIKRELGYYFWSKAEWEMIIEITESDRVILIPWCGCKEPEEAQIDVTDDKSFDWKGFAEKHINEQIYHKQAKIDVYDQIDYVWDEFVEYVWKNRKELLKK